MGAVGEWGYGNTFEHEREEVTGTDIKFFNKEMRISKPTPLHVFRGIKWWMACMFSIWFSQ
jgi:hypothetical protein